MAFLKTPSARRFTATLAAAATALALMTAAAVPAHASNSNDDFAKAIAAIATIALIGTALNKSKKKSKEHVYQPPRREPHSRNTVLPAHCAVEVRGHRKNQVVYPAQCLNRAGINSRLPSNCKVSMRGRGHDRTAYEQQCLLKSGFQKQSRRRR